MDEFQHKSKQGERGLHGALDSYLLPGMLWGLIYSLLEGLRPGYFDISLDLLEENRLLCIYCSFITLTTLGYSDISLFISLSVCYLCWKRFSANSIWRYLSLPWWAFTSVR